MTSDIILKLFPIFFSDIAICVALVIAVGNDVFARPRLMCILLFLILDATAGYFLWLSKVTIIYFIYFCILNGVFLIIIYFQTRNRDINGIKLGQATLDYMSKVDEAICYIADRVSKDHAPASINQSIVQSLDALLIQICDLLDLNISGGAQLSIFRSQGGRFSVPSQIGLKANQVEYIENNFRYQNPILGLAGHALSERKTICIKDLSKTKDPNYNKWNTTYPAEQRKGSIICVPLFRGIGDVDSEQMGVLNVASPQKGLLFSPSVRSLLNRYADKIEILLYCLEMIEKRQA